MNFVVSQFNDSKVVVCHLRHFRNQAGLTQTQLAKLVGCSQNTISSIEVGQYCATVDLALSLAAALSCSVSDLFSLDDRYFV